MIELHLMQAIADRLAEQAAKEGEETVTLSALDEFGCTVESLGNDSGWYPGCVIRLADSVRRVIVGTGPGGLLEWSEPLLPGEAAKVGPTATVTPGIDGWPVYLVDGAPGQRAIVVYPAQWQRVSRGMGEHSTAVLGGEIHVYSSTGIRVDRSDRSEELAFDAAWGPAALDAWARVLQVGELVQFGADDYLTVELVGTEWRTWSEAVPVGSGAEDELRRYMGAIVRWQVSDLEMG